MPKVIALELENFQTIAKRTVIPIRPLTLTFGPNGAGKSALFDAIELIKLIVSDDWGVENANLIDALERHSRNSATNTPTNSLGIGIQLEMESDWTYEYLGHDKLKDLQHINYFDFDEGGAYPELLQGKTITLYAEFRKGERRSSWGINELVIAIDSKVALQARAEPDHYPLLTVFDQEWLSTYRLSEDFKRKGGLFKVSESEIQSYLESSLGWYCSARRWFVGPTGDTGTERSFSLLVQEIIDFSKLIVQDSLSVISFAGASRLVPTTRQSIALVRGTSYKGHGEKEVYGFDLNWSRLLVSIKDDINQCGAPWVELCEAVADSLGREGSDEPASFGELSALGRINSFLREELFIENGYQLTGEVFCLAQPDQFDEIPTSDVRGYAKLVRLFLVDAHQRRVEIEDVGSGIAYVLPILVALAGSRIALIQQPELHLHPALQSKLGDVIVKAVESKNGFEAFTLVETHSEHLLLRVMRLIRNASSRKQDDLVPLTNEDLAILYFEPIGVGESRVKRLRLSAEGELIDRWPGGFFNERYKDIFDE